MLDLERELAKLGVPIKTRHNEVAPNQFEVAPIYESTNVGCDHQMLTMQIMQNTARRYGLVCLLHEKPFAGVNGSGKHNNWSMGTDTGENLLNPGDTPAGQPAVPVLLLGRHPGRQQAPGPAARLRRQPGPGSPPRRQRGAAGDHLDLPRDRLEGVFDAIERRQGDQAQAGRIPRPRTPVLPPLPLHSGRPQPHEPVRLHRQQVRVPRARLQPVAGPGQHVLNTIVAEAIDDLATKLEAALKSDQDLEKAVLKVVKESYAENKQVVFGGDGYSEEWHDEAEKRGLLNLPTTPDALPELVDKSAVALFKKYKVLSKRELDARYDVLTEQYSVMINIEAETAATIARTMLLPAALRHLAELKAAGIEALVGETSR